MNVAICALTYKRPDGLRRLLEGYQQLVFPEPAPEVHFVIVDNDPAGSGRAICEEFATRLRGPLQYVIEPQPGIAPARNAALDNTTDAEWICFIDDDEVPDPQWLAELLRVQREYQADVVAGPSLAYFPEPVSDWIVKGRFFGYRRYPTGHRLTHAFTHNVLFRRRILGELKLRFDHRWALVGCEDRHFFQQIGMAGYKIVWANEAVATEWIPSSRTNGRWLIRRHYRVGCASSLVEMDLRPFLPTAPLQMGKSLVWLLIGAVQTIFSPFRGRHAIVQGVQSLAYGLGQIVGLVGIPYEEYRRKKET